MLRLRRQIGCFGRTLVCVAVGMLCMTRLVSAQTALPPIVTDNFNAFFPASAKYHETCAPMPDGSSICSYPSMVPCKDRDRDGLFKCAINISEMRTIHFSEVNRDFSVKKLSWPLFKNNRHLRSPWFYTPDALDFRRCTLLPPDAYFEVPYYACSFAPNYANNLDCDDGSSAVREKSSGVNLAPIHSIVYIDREQENAREMKLRDQVNLDKLSAFSPVDILMVGVRTSPCVSYLTAKVDLDFGVGEPLFIGEVSFRPADTHPAALRAEAPKGEGILYGKVHLPSFLGPAQNQEVLSKMLAKIRQKRERTGHTTTTSAGPVSARLVLHNSLGAQSIPISMDTCVPVFGDGPISITMRRPSNLKSFLPGSWAIRPVDFASAFANYTLETPPFRQDKALFSVVADLSLLTERETLKNENSTSKIDVTGPASCGGRFYLYESAFNQRANAQPGNGAVMDPTKPWYNGHSAGLGEYYLLVATHEFGHALGHLRDEYDNLGWNPGAAPDYAWYQQRNCATEKKIDSAFPAPGNVPAPARAFCGARGNYRSTIGSMMNDQYENPKFNVVSCAYLLAEMRGGSAPAYYATCEQKEYDTYRE